MASLTSSAIAMTAASVLRLGAQLLTVPLLSRYLTPHEYGIVALAMPIIALGMALGDAGLCTSLVRQKTFEMRTWSSAFWLLTAFGAVNVMLIAVLSPLTTYLYRDPEVSTALLALSGALFLQALTNVAGADLQRAGRFKRLATIEISATLIGMVTAVIMAMRGFGYWALVGQQIAFWIVRSIATWTSSKIRPTAGFEMRAILPHLKFGYLVLQTAAVSFLNRSIDSMMVGAVMGPSEAGLYAMAMQFMRLPTLLLIGPLFSVILTIASRLHEHKARVRTMYLAMTAVLAALVLPPMFVAAAAHRTLFALLLSPKWHEAATLFGLMAPIGAMNAVTILSYPFLQAIGRPDVQLRVSIENSVVWIICLALALQVSLTAVAMTLTVSYLIYLPRFCTIVFPVLDCTIGSYVRACAVPFVLSTLAALLYWLIRDSVAGMPLADWAIIVSLAAMGVGVSLLTARTSVMTLLRMETIDIAVAEVEDATPSI